MVQHVRIKECANGDLRGGKRDMATEQMFLLLPLIVIFITIMSYIYNTLEGRKSSLQRENRFGICFEYLLV